MKDSTRRRFLRAGGVVGIAGLTGCSQITGGNGVKDTDGDGVIDSEDYAPRDASVQDAEDVGETDSTEPDTKDEEDASGRNGGPREEIPLSVHRTVGPVSQRNHQWRNNRLIMEAGDINAEEGDVETINMVSASVVFSTNDPINFSPISDINISFKQSSVGGNQDTSYLAVASRRDAINFHPVAYAAGRSYGNPSRRLMNKSSSIGGALYFKDRDMNARGNETLGVGDISGQQYLGIGVNCGSKRREEMTFELFEMQGINASGTEVFYLDFTAQSLILDRDSQF